jgi:hypothetical protein
MSHGQWVITRRMESIVMKMLVARVSSPSTSSNALINAMRTTMEVSAMFHLECAVATLASWARRALSLQV